MHSFDVCQRMVAQCQQLSWSFEVHTVFVVGMMSIYGCIAILRPVAVHSVVGHAIVSLFCLSFLVCMIDAALMVMQAQPWVWLLLLVISLISSGCSASCAVYSVVRNNSGLHRALYTDIACGREGLGGVQFWLQVGSTDCSRDVLATFKHVPTHFCSVGYANTSGAVSIVQCLPNMLCFV